MTVPRATLRADASARVGYGHVIRSLTLGQELVERGWEVRVASVALPEVLRVRARGAGIAVVDLAVEAGSSQDGAATASLDSDLVVVDGYLFSPGFFAKLQQTVAVIDDDGTTPCNGVRVLVNQNPHADAALYPKADAGTTLLLGLDYALVRRDVTDQADRPSTADVFVSLGGADPNRLTAELCDALAASGLVVAVAVAPSDPFYDEVSARLRANPMVRTVDQDGFVAALSGARVAVVSAGTTMWEAAHVGTPAVAIVVADNQAAASSAAEVRGFLRRSDARAGLAARAIVADVQALLSRPDELAAMGALGRASVDGRGAARVANTLDAVVAC